MNVRNAPRHIPVFLDKPDPSREPRPKRLRRWTLPLPPVDSGEALEGIEVLHECADAAGLELFECLRDVLLWIYTPEALRAQLFVDHRIPGSAEALPPALVGAVATLRLLSGHSLATDDVANACSTISIWAFETGFLSIAIAFAHAAARVKPEDPELAFYVGRSTRDAGRLAHAEAWFQRTAGLARKKRSREMLTAAYFGSGVVHERRGHRAAARRTFEKALRTASVGGLDRMAAIAHQYLIPLTIEQYETSFDHAAAALALCPSGDLQLARIAVDAGAMFSEHSYFGLAYILYEAALPHITRVSDRLACLANICRAAAALGLKHRVAEGWSDIDLIALHGIPVFYSESLVELAHGHVTLGYWKQAARILADAEKADVHQTVGSKIARLRRVIEERGTGDIDRSPTAEAVQFTETLRMRLGEMV